MMTCVESCRSGDVCLAIGLCIGWYCVRVRDIHSPFVLVVAPLLGVYEAVWPGPVVGPASVSVQYMQWRTSCEVCCCVSPLLISSSRCVVFRTGVGCGLCLCQGSVPCSFYRSSLFHIYGVEGTCMQVVPMNPPRLLNAVSIICMQDFTDFNPLRFNKRL